MTKNHCVSIYNKKLWFLFFWEQREDAKEARCAGIIIFWKQKIMLFVFKKSIIILFWREDAEEARCSSIIILYIYKKS